MNSKHRKLDILSVPNLVNLFVSEENKTLQAIKGQKTNIAKAINQIIDKIQNKGKIIYIGSGTSGRLGILDAVECNPTFNTNSFQAIIAGGQNAFLKAKEGAEDNKVAAIKDLKKLKLTKTDIVIGISASGETPYTLAAVKFAKAKRITTIGISSKPKSTLAKISSIDISPELRSELIQGSTRLKSGTAQKIILNMLSSISLIKSGKVYNDLMIDVKPTNKKLVKRAIGIISIVCNISFNKAKSLFIKSKKNTKAAIIMHFKKCSLNEALKHLNKSNYNLRKLIG